MRLGIKHVVVAALAVCAVTGCSLATAKSSDTTSSSSQASSQSSTAAKVGQPLTVTDSVGDSAQATVVSVVDKTAGKTDTDEAPVNGQFAVITVQIKGIKGSFDVNALNVRYQAANGNTYDETAGNGIASGYDPELPSGPVAAGASAGGVVVVDTPSGAPKEIKLTDDLGTVLGTWTP